MNIETDTNFTQKFSQPKHLCSKVCIAFYFTPLIHSSKRQYFHRHYVLSAYDKRISGIQKAEEHFLFPTIHIALAQTHRYT